MKNKMSLNVGVKFPWRSRKSTERGMPEYLAERLDRYVTSMEKPKVESTADERMALRARLEMAFDRW
jgi:hypothetical protein